MVEELQVGRSVELTYELLRGAIDLHVHPGPHLKSSPRRVDPIDCAIEARDAGMRAMVYLDCFEMSNGITWLVNRHVENFTVFGGLIMNTVYGGMNPRSVTTALEYGDGAKYIQFGTHSTYYQASKEGRVVDGKFKPLAELYPKFRDEELGRAISIPVKGDLSPELDEILKAVADHKGVYLDTGHVSVPEALRLCELKDQYGIEHLIISGSVTKIATIDELKKMVKMGALVEQSLAGFSAAQMVPLTHYYVEKEYASIDEGMKEPETDGIRVVAKQVRALGAENMVINTDFGRYALSTPVEGLRQFISLLLDMGISKEEVRTMVKTNPEKVLGLKPLPPESFPIKEKGVEINENR